MSKMLFGEYPVRTKKNKKAGEKLTTTTAVTNKHCKLVDDDVPTFSLPALKKAIVNHYWVIFSHLLLLISTNYV